MRRLYAKHKIGLVHITELCDPAYPWQELFSLLKADGYSGYTLAEIPASTKTPAAQAAMRPKIRQGPAARDKRPLCAIAARGGRSSSSMSGRA